MRLIKTFLVVFFVLTTISVARGVPITIEYIFGTMIGTSLGYFTVEMIWNAVKNHFEKE